MSKLVARYAIVREASTSRLLEEFVKPKTLGYQAFWDFVKGDCQKRGWTVVQTQFAAGPVEGAVYLDVHTHGQRAISVVIAHEAGEKNAVLATFENETNLGGGAFVENAKVDCFGRGWKIDHEYAGQNGGVYYLAVILPSNGADVEEPTPDQPEAREAPSQAPAFGSVVANWFAQVICQVYTLIGSVDRKESITASSEIDESGTYLIVGIEIRCEDESIPHSHCVMVLRRCRLTDASVNKAEIVLLVFTPWKTTSNIAIGTGQDDPSAQHPLCDRLLARIRSGAVVTKAQMAEFERDGESAQQPLYDRLLARIRSAGAAVTKAQMVEFERDGESAQQPLCDILLVRVRSADHSVNGWQILAFAVYAPSTNSLSIEQIGHIIAEPTDPVIDPTANEAFGEHARVLFGFEGFQTSHIITFSLVLLPSVPAQRTSFNGPADPLVKGHLLIHLFMTAIADGITQGRTH